MFPLESIANDVPELARAVVVRLLVVNEEASFLLPSATVTVLVVKKDT